MTQNERYFSLVWVDDDERRVNVAQSGTVREIEKKEHRPSV
jgi:hypothetical protein